MTIILLVSVFLIAFAIIVPKPNQRHRAKRIEYLLDRAEERLNSDAE